MQKRSIEKLVEETLNSLEGAKRAEAKPFLLTRVLAKINSGEETANVWTRISVFLSKPAVALAGLLLIVLINAAIIFSNTKDKENMQNINSSKDEFAVNVLSIYESENQEP